MCPVAAIGATEGPLWVACCRSQLGDVEAVYANCMGQHSKANRTFERRRTASIERLLLADRVNSPMAAHGRSGSQKLNSAD
jgi:hypothetical protein